MNYSACLSLSCGSASHAREVRHLRELGRRRLTNWPKRIALAAAAPAPGRVDAEERGLIGRRPCGKRRVDHRDAVVPKEVGIDAPRAEPNFFAGAEARGF